MRAVATAAALAVAALTFAAPAFAHHGPAVQTTIKQAEVTKGVQVGQATYGAYLDATCGLLVEEGTTQPNPYTPGRLAAGEASNCINDTTFEDLPLGHNYVLLESGWLRSASASSICDVVAHEIGHLTGLGHSDNPADNMYGGDGGPGHLAACGISDAEAYRRAVAAQAALAPASGNGSDDRALRVDALLDRAATYRERGAERRRQARRLRRAARRTTGVARRRLLTRARRAERLARHDARALRAVRAQITALGPIA